MSEKKELNIEELEKVSGGIDSYTLYFVNQIIQMANQRVINKHGQVSNQETYNQLLGDEIYAIFLTLTEQGQEMIRKYVLEVGPLWSGEGVRYFAE